jgi:hypothetical protein
MSAHYEICILLIEFEEDKFGMRVSTLCLYLTSIMSRVSCN